MNHLIKNINRWKFDKKMKVLLSFSLILTSMVILLVSTISSFRSMTDQSRRMADDQLAALSSNYEDMLESYKAIAIAITMDPAIQSYSKEMRQKNNYDQIATNAFNTLFSALYMNRNFNFIAILNYNIDSYLYKGRTSMSNSHFLQMHEIDYRESKPAYKTGTLRMNFSNHYHGDRYTLTLYFPIYSTNEIFKENGLLIINVEDNFLKQLHYRSDTDSNSEMFLVDQEGIIVSIADEHKIGKPLSCFDRIGGISGSFWKDGELVNYRRVGDWNYYLINVIPAFELYKDSFRVMTILILLIAAMTLICLYLTRKIVNHFYQPLDKVVSKMDSVTEGRLDARINTENTGDDFVKLAVGFNSMMDEIQILMEEVKIEQHQIEQIRFNALQSQIQPHFLYNTLECIHWQAMAEGNREVSTMVKALAQYYRICLSRGKDIISLKQELEHIENYLIIQNMRYDNIIDLEIAIPSFFLDLSIPKMTLQPLIENSIYHGIKVKDGKTGIIRLSIRQSGADVYIMVEDSGTGMTDEEIARMNHSISIHEESFGYGVRNVNKRIEILFGPEYGLTFLKNQEGGVTVEIHLPKESDVLTARGYDHV